MGKPTRSWRHSPTLCLRAEFGCCPGFLFHSLECELQDGNQGFCEVRSGYLPANIHCQKEEKLLQITNCFQPGRFSEDDSLFYFAIPSKHPSDLNLTKTSELLAVCGYSSKIHFELQWKSYDNFSFRNSAGISEDNCRKQFKGTFEGCVLYSILQQLSVIHYSSGHQSTASDLLKQQISMFSK